MKEAIGGTWIFTIVIVLLAVFTCFLSVSTNYARTYNIKDKIINIINNERGVNQKTLSLINKELKKIGYGANGECPKDCWYAFSKDKDNATASYAANVDYCIKRHTLISHNDTGVSSGAAGHPSSSYYSVIVFFEIDIPVFGELFRLDVAGQTSTISVPRDTFIPENGC